jgi:iron complex transport system substrate-binding protein
VRICSLLPSATEIVFALGLGDSLVGVTHECDYPRETAQIPKVTRSHIPPGISSRQIDSATSSALNQNGSLYELDVELLEKLRPDLILTQRLCAVCAVSFDRVEEAVAGLPSRPAVLNLEPHSLADILASIGIVANAITGREAVIERAEELISGCEARINRIRRRTASLAQRTRVFCMEWVDPPYCGGHWMKELVEIAGGRDDLANLHRPSYRIEWKRVVEFAPEVFVLTCCGFSLERVEQEAECLARFEGFHALPAAKTGRVYATDGSAYFSRPGPRIVDSLEILAHLIHPDLFPAPRLARAFSAPFQGFEIKR